MKVLDKFTIHGRLPCLNDYIKSSNRNRYESNNLKKKTQNKICRQILSEFVGKHHEPVDLLIIWYEKDLKRDYDNIVFAKKFILDAMVLCNVIPNDNRKYINDIRDIVKVDRESPRVEVYIIEKKIKEEI